MELKWSEVERSEAKWSYDVSDDGCTAETCCMIKQIVCFLFTGDVPVILTTQRDDSNWNYTISL